MFSLVTALLLFIGTQAQAQDYAILFDEPRLMASIGDDAPARGEYLEKLRDRDASNYYKELYRTGKTLYDPNGDPRIRSHFKDVWALQGLLTDLAFDFHMGPSSERGSTRREMSDVASEIEVLTIEITELRLVMMERSLIRVRTAIKRYETNEVRRVDNQVRRSLQGNKR